MYSFALNHLKLSYKNEYEKHADIDESLLADIERTTIIKLSNMKSFRVSPIKKKTKVIDESQIETL